MWITQNLANDEQFNRHLNQYYRQTEYNIEKIIDQEIVNLEKHNISRQTVNNVDVEAYQREAKKVVEEAKQMRKAGKHVSYADFSKEVNDRMRIYNATMRINRLEYIKSQIGLELVECGMYVDDDMRNKLSDDYIAEVTRQAGVLGVTVTSTSLWYGKKVAKAVMAQTNSATFSQRIWANQDVLKARLDEVMSTGVINGDNPREMARRLKDQVRKTVDNQRYVTERIARTESARVQYTAQKDALKEGDYRFCKWHAEPGHCKVCGEIASNDPDGNGRGVYEVDDVPIIPAHPNCRCSISAYWVDGKNNSYKATVGASRKSKDKNE